MHAHPRATGSALGPHRSDQAPARAGRMIPRATIASECFASECHILVNSLSHLLVLLLVVAPLPRRHVKELAHSPPPRRSAQYAGPRRWDGCGVSDCADRGRLSWIHSGCPGCQISPSDAPLRPRHRPARRCLQRHALPVIQLRDLYLARPRWTAQVSDGRAAIVLHRAACILSDICLAPRLPAGPGHP